MIPTINEQFLQDFTEVSTPSKDYALNSNTLRINGTINDLEEVRQAVYFVLNTERYDYLIYSWDYGVEFKDLLGQPMSYVIPEVERRITEALTQDERISEVTDFVFEKQKKKLHVTFNVITIFGNFESEVNVNV